MVSNLQRAEKCQEGGQGPYKITSNKYQKDGRMCVWRKKRLEAHQRVALKKTGLRRRAGTGRTGHMPIHISSKIRCSWTAPSHHPPNFFHETCLPSEARGGCDPAGWSAVKIVTRRSFTRGFPFPRSRRARKVLIVVGVNVDKRLWFV